MRARRAGGKGVGAPGGAGDALPQANAGAPQNQTGLGLVTLDGSASINYDTVAWTLDRYDIGSGAATDKTDLLSDATAIGPTFTPEAAEYVYVATLVVTAGEESHTARTTILTQSWNLLDPSLGTLANTSMLATDASDSEYIDWTGKSGADGHGTFTDSGCDGAQNLQDVGDPAGYAGIELLMELVEVSAGNQSGTDEGVRLMVSGSHTVTANVATMAGGFYVESSNDALRPANVGGRSGQWSKSNTDLDDTVTGFAPALCHSRLMFDLASAPDVVGGLARIVASDATEGSAGSSAGLPNLTGVCLVGAGMDVPATTPAAGPRFKFRIWWRWIKEAAVPA